MTWSQAEPGELIHRIYLPIYASIGFATFTRHSGRAKFENRPSHPASSPLEPTPPPS
jgi:hypothetical protein